MWQAASQSRASWGSESLRTPPTSKGKCRIREGAETWPSQGRAGQGRGWRYHDEALRQAGTGQEVDDAQPLGEPQVSEGGRLQCDGVGCGRPHSQLPLQAHGPPHWLSWGQAGFRGQPLVQVRQLLEVQQSGPKAAVQWLPTHTWGRARPLLEVCTSHPEIPEHCQG